MTLVDILVIALAYLAAGTVKGGTGLGFSTTCLPILVLAVGLKEAMPLLVLPSLASNAMVMIRAGHFKSTVKLFWPLYLAVVPGLIAGLYLLTQNPADIATVLLGGVLIAYSLFALASPRLALPKPWRLTLAAPAGFLTGFVNGFTGSQVMPLLPYLMALPLPPDRFIQALNISFTLSSGLLLFLLAQVGFLTWSSVAISIAGLAPVFAGVALGTRLRRGISQTQFRKVVLYVLLGLGVLMIVKSLLGTLPT